MVQAVHTLLNKITRHAGPCSFQFIGFSTFSSLTNTIRDLKFPTDLIFADLSYGAWRGQQIAHEFAGQLGITLPTLSFTAPPKPQSFSHEMPSYAEAIGTFVDAESAGNPSITKSLRYAESLIQHIQTIDARTFVVLPPTTPFGWEEENQWFLYFFYHGLQSTPCQLLFATTQQPAPITLISHHIHWRSPLECSQPNIPTSPIHHFPGVISNSLIEPMNLTLPADLIPLHHHHCLVPPESRNYSLISKIKTNNIIKFNHKAIDTIYAMLYQKPIHIADAIEQAWCRYAEGGTGIALRLLDFATQQSQSPLERAILLIQSHGLRIGLQQFNGVIRNHQSPPDTIPAWMRGFLHQCLGWSQTMLNQPIDGANHLAKARALLKQPQNAREYLYLLNISALNLLKQNQQEQALELEQRIEQALNAQADEDHHLIYLNSLNTARLYRLKQEWNLAEHYFQKAFETHLGVRSEGDQIYMHLLLAQLNEKQHKWQLAFQHWLKAALFWLSADAPEAIPPRVYQSLTRTKLADSITTVESVSKALHQHLEHCAQQLCLKPSFTFHPEIQVSFRNTKNLDHTFFQNQSLRLCCYNPIALIVADAPSAPQYNGTDWNRLSQWVVQNLFGTLPSNQTIIVDDLFGTDLPSTPADMLAVMLKHNISILEMNSHTITLSPADRHTIHQAATLHYSPALATIQFGTLQTKVTYKRYRPDEYLDPSATQLLRIIQTPCSTQALYDKMAKTHSPCERDKLVTMLEQKHIIQRKIPQFIVDSIFSLSPSLQSELKPS